MIELQGTLDSFDEWHERLARSGEGWRKTNSTTQ